MISQFTLKKSNNKLEICSNLFNKGGKQAVYAWQLSQTSLYPLSKNDKKHHATKPVVQHCRKYNFVYKRRLSLKANELNKITSCLFMLANPVFCFLTENSSSHLSRRVLHHIWAINTWCIFKVGEKFCSTHYLVLIFLPFKKSR